MSHTGQYEPSKLINLSNNKTAVIQQHEAFIIHAEKFGFQRNRGAKPDPKPKKRQRRARAPA